MRLRGNLLVGLTYVGNQIYLCFAASLMAAVNNTRVGGPLEMKNLERSWFCPDETWEKFWKLKV